MGRLELLENFIHVVDAGSISAAAQRLGTAKSAVSRHLADLESRLSTQLLTRTTRRISLTAAGARVYEQAQALIASAKALETCLDVDNSALAGSIRMSASMSFGLSHLNAALASFAQAHPAIELYVDLNDRRVDMVAEGYDLVLRIGALKDSTLVSRKLTDIRGLVVASPGYLARHGTPATPAELSAHRCVRYALGRTSGWRYADPKGRTGSVAVRPAIESTSGEFLRECLVQDQGIGMLPSFIVHAQLRSGALSPILTHYRWLSAGLHVLYPQRAHQPARIRALIDFLVATFAVPVPPWEHDLPGLNSPPGLNSTHGAKRSKKPA